ncbi:MAG: glycosyltransferase family 4 protein [Clostridiales bacterium]|nr:glycosyltransferase family 4 protein [Clostridiales bacterium]
MKKIVILVNSDIVIYNFRLELVEALLSNGYQVVIVSPYGKRIDFLTQLGCKFIELNLARHGKNLFQDLNLLKNYKKILKLEKPDVVLTYTIKPNIYGGMACQSLKIPYIANITGLGDAIENGGLLQKITLFLYKLGLKKAKNVFFQNASNQKFFLDNKIVKGNNDLLPGSGVNIERFAYAEYPTNDAIKLLFIGRITRDKGVNELAEVAKIIASKYQNVVFDIVGWADEGSKNPFETLGNCYCHGSQVEVKPFIEKTHAIVLPSYHEGMANVLLEAASCGRPILASNIPGCQETFEEGVTGFGFEPKNIESLCEVIEKFIALPYEQKCEMGKLGRKKMEEQFNRQIVVNKYLEQINSL